tara:strand:+ start:2054 stop:2368 length:315 start_codon:yes stop_codon:yes gene_type:complete
LTPYSSTDYSVNQLFVELEKKMEQGNEFAPDVKQAIDDVVVQASTKSVNGLARRLDVSKQALSKWRNTGMVPPLRALEMSLMTEEKVSWKRLLPDVVYRFNHPE